MGLKEEDDESDRFRCNYAIRRMHRNKIKNSQSNAIFDARMGGGIRTFKWMQGTLNDESDEDSENAEDSKSGKRMIEKRFIGQHRLRETEQSAKRVLDSMRTKMKKAKDENIKSDDAICRLKLQMIAGCEQEIEHFTQTWEDELNTISELIRFQIPLRTTNANLHRLRQQIAAKQMLFDKKIRMLSELRTQKRLKYVVKDEEEVATTENIESDQNLP